MFFALQGTIFLLFRMQKQVLLDMEDKYPFGELSKLICDKIHPFVRKTLHFQTQAQRQMIYQMVYLLNTVKHHNLVNLQKTLEAENCVDIYYQYAPFKLQKWILDVNQEAASALEKQLLDLVQYLNRSSFKFDFDPSSVGLSQDMSIKYFLNDFSIDIDNKHQNLQIMQKHVRQFFVDFCQTSTAKPTKQRESVDIERCRRFESLSTNDSHEQLQGLAQSKSLSKRDKSSSVSKNKNQLSQKVQDSMKKSLQVLLRFKKTSRNRLL